MANLTLVIPDDLLNKARNYAALKGVSLSSLITKYLEDFTQSEEQLKKSTQKLLQLCDNYASKSQKWTRKELYES